MMETNKVEDNDIKTEYFDCQCFSSEHTLRFVYMPAQKNIDGSIDDVAELHAEIYLNQYRNIFSRIWVAIKYVFGYKCKYGHWDAWMLKANDCERLRDLVSKMIEKNAK